MTIVTLHKRGGAGSTFATHTEHTQAFNTVHIIAAVIGVAGALIVTITILIYYKKRKQAHLLKIKSDLEKGNRVEPATSTITTSRFGQFATDFDNTVQVNHTPPSPPPELILQENTASPLMQQHQLQIKLLQNRTVSSSIIPPPPYQP